MSARWHAFPLFALHMFHYSFQIDAMHFLLYRVVEYVCLLQLPLFGTYMDYQPDYCACNIAFIFNSLPD